jgi:hypothetical protein
MMKLAMVPRSLQYKIWVSQICKQFPRGDKRMRRFQRTLTIFGSALAVFSVSAGNPAKAGDGADLGTLQTSIDATCQFFGMSSCPQLPTIAQGVLQIAAFLNVAPEAVRASPGFAIPGGPYIDAGNPSHPPGLGCLGTGCVDPLNPIAGLPIDPGALSSLRPLAFVSARSGPGPAKPTQLYDQTADSFVYAVGGLSAANIGSPGPDTLVLFYDDPGRITKNFKLGDSVGLFSLPLTIFDGTNEQTVTATLEFKVPAAHAAPCSASKVSGSFLSGGTAPPAALGIDCALVFAPSPVSKQPHAVFEITVPILVTILDPAIAAGSFFGLESPFLSGEPGFTPAPSVLGGTGLSVGIAPNAAPFGPAATTTSPGTFALCADLPREGNGHVPVPSVAAFYAIGGDGEVRLSAPLAAGVPIVCPAGL